MADGVSITAGSGTTILTDDTGAGGHAQVVKLAISTDGSATLIPADGTDGMLVNLGANNDVTLGAAIPAGNNNIGDVDIASIAAGDNNIGNVDIVTMPNVTLAAGTNTNEVVGDVAHDVAAAGNPLQIGAYSSAAAPTDTAADGRVARLWSLRNGALAVQPTASGTIIAAGNGTAAASMRVTIASDSTGQVAVASIAAGNNNIGDVDIASIAAGDNNIGNVDIVTMPNVTLAAGTNTNEVVGDVAHDVAAAGNPLQIGAYSSAAAPTDTAADGRVARLWSLRNGALAVQPTASGTIIAAGNGTAATAMRVSIASDSTGQVAVASLPASTNTIEVVGDIAHDTGVGGNPVQVAAMAIDMDDTAPPLTVSAEQDVVRFGADRDGTLFAHPHGPRVWSYHLDTSTAQTDTSVHAAPAAGLSLYVTDIAISLGAATALNVFFEEGATKVLGPYYLEAVNGRNLKITFQTPKKITAATALTVTTSASVAHCVDVTGFTAQG